MSDYTIYALKGSDNPDINVITHKSLKEGIGRFG